MLRALGWWGGGQRPQPPISAPADPKRNTVYFGPITRVKGELRSRDVSSTPGTSTSTQGPSTSTSTHGASTSTSTQGTSTSTSTSTM